MSTSWKPGQRITPNQPLYNPDPSGQEHKGGLIVLGVLAAIVGFFFLLAVLFARLVG